MITLISITGLGIICLLLEVLNLRKLLIPLVLIGLLGILGFTIVECNLAEPLWQIDSNNMIVSTKYSQAFSCLFILLTLFIIVMSPNFYAQKISKIADYTSLYLFMLVGAVAMVSFGNLAMFFIGLEILSIAAYVLSGSNAKNLRSNEAGLKYFLMGSFASGFILFGIALVYGAAGSFDNVVISEFFREKMMEKALTLPIWPKLGFIMILIGLFFKASLVPFHFWAPDVYEGSPTLVTTTMSTLVKVAALAALFKIFSIMFQFVIPPVKIALVIISILSLTIGNITALKQKNLKRIMAYSGISHAGFMLMSILSIGVTANSANTFLYYSIAYSLAAIAAFAIIMAVTEYYGSEDISSLYGLYKKSPLLAVTMTCAMLSLGGIPVFAGFFAKLFTFTEMFKANYIVLVILGVLNSIVAIYYYFSTVSVMFTKKNEDPDPSVSFPQTYIIVAVVAMLLNLVIGVFPSLIMDIEL